MLRLIWIIIGLGLLPGLQMNVRGQFSAPVPPVTLDLRNVELIDILTELEKQTGLFFSYESSLLKDLPKVTLIADEEALSYCLKRLFTTLPLNYRVTGQYVILKSRPRTYTISGFVRDSASYESLISATVLDRVSGKGTTTNSYGFYSITLPAGLVSLYSSYVGYQLREVSFELTKDTLIDLNLSTAGLIQEIVIRGVDPQSEMLSSQLGSIHLSANQIRHVPVVFGEPDLIKTLQFTPGIASGTEGLTGMYVRGGGGDENLFLLDGIPVYNVNHLGGLFSTFNPDIVKNVDFYKGSFPARYGGRLSSVTDVRLKDGDMQNYHGSFSIGLLAVKANLEGPLIKDKTSFNLAFRRTWYDAVTTPVFAIKNKKNDYGFFVGYSFYDLNAKINHLFNSRSRLYANFYMGQDRLRYEEYEWYNEFPIGEKFTWRWGNLVTSLNWNYIFSNKLFSNLNVAYSRYKLKVREEEQRLKVIKGDVTDLQVNQILNRHSSGIEDIGFIYNLDYSPVPEHHVKGGVQYLFHSYRPEDKFYMASILEKKEYLSQQIQYVTHQDPLVHAHEWAVFAEDEWLPGERWKINIGARLSSYHVEREDYFSFQPRASVRYLITPDLSVKGGYTKMSQYVHQLSNTYANLPSDIWVPVTANIKPLESHQYTAGLYYNYKKLYDLSMEGYYKKMSNIIEYQDNASLFPQYVQWDEKISMGSGRSYGMEWMLRKPEGRTTGWIAYTLAWSNRIYRDGTVNEGLRFPSKFDNRHRLNLTLMHKINDNIDISASWTFATGNRVTIPVDYYISPDMDPAQTSGKPHFGSPVYSGTQYQFYVNNGYETILRRNAFKLSNYHRLDLSLNIYRPRKNGHVGIWNISLYNAYSRMNPFCIDYISYQAPGELRISQRGLIPIIPSFSYTYKF